MVLVVAMGIPAGALVGDTDALGPSAPLCVNRGMDIVNRARCIPRYRTGAVAGPSAQKDIALDEITLTAILAGALVKATTASKADRVDDAPKATLGEIALTAIPAGALVKVTAASRAKEAGMGGGGGGQGDGGDQEEGGGEMHVDDEWKCLVRM
jgi:hypothetical protein